MGGQRTIRGEALDKLVDREMGPDEGVEPMDEIKKLLPPGTKVIDVREGQIEFTYDNIPDKAYIAVPVVGRVRSR